MSRRAALSVAVVLALAATGCSTPADSPSGAAETVTVDSCGQQLSFPSSPGRVVTLDQSATETLLELGLAGRMVGTANLKTKVAPQYQADYAKVPVLNPGKLTGEQLRAATPDLVVSAFDALYTADQVGTRQELAGLGLPSYVSAVDCPEIGGQGKTPFDLLLADYENLGRIFGIADRAAALVAAQRGVIEQAALTGQRVQGGPSVVWLYSTFKGLPYVAGKGGMPSEMSRLVGARNAFDDVDEQWPEVSWEQIAQRDPDFIVVGDLSERGSPGDSAEEKIALMRQDPTVSQLKAVRENRIIQVPGIEMDPSVRTVNTLRLLAEGMTTLGYAR